MDGPLLDTTVCSESSSQSWICNEQNKTLKNAYTVECVTVPPEVSERLYCASSRFIDPQRHWNM